MKGKNKTFLKFIVPIIVVVAMYHGIVRAGDKDYLNYVRIGTGFYQPTGGLDDAGYDAGPNFSFLYGRYFGKYLVLEGGGGFFYAERDYVGSTSAAGYYSGEDSVGILSASGPPKGYTP